MRSSWRMPSTTRERGAVRNVGKRLMQYIESLSGVAEDRVIAELRKRTESWPKTPSELSAAGLMPVTAARPYSEREKAAHELHQRSLEQLRAAERDFIDAR